MAGERVQLRGAAARAAILAAARTHFAEDGWRRTSIEAIAASAGVSRPTVYAHFGSKDDVLRTIVADLHEEQLEAMYAAIATADSVADRLNAALAARFVPFVTITATSEHGAELLDESSRHCGDIIRDAHRRSVALLKQVLADGQADGSLDLPRHGLTPGTAATVVYDAARGAKDDPTLTPTAYRRQLRRLVSVLTDGLSAR